MPAASPAVPARMQADPASGPLSAAVVVRVNGADVVVPEGVSEPHVASVLRAVASL